MSSISPLTPPAPTRPFVSAPKCPHCGVVATTVPVSVATNASSLTDGSPIAFRYLRSGASVLANVSACPACGEIIIWLTHLKNNNQYGRTELAWPKGINRPIAAEVKNDSPDLARDFEEAVAVLSVSPKASAALSRRCLQALIVRKANAVGRTLYAQIEDVINRGGLPSHLVESLHIIREIGNAAAHPIHSGNTGEIVDIEESEAEWMLEAIEQLFDFYIVVPAKANARTAELKKKFGKAGAQQP